MSQYWLISNLGENLKLISLGFNQTEISIEKMIQNLKQIEKIIYFMTTSEENFNNSSKSLDNKKEKEL